MRIALHCIACYRPGIPVAKPPLNPWVPGVSIRVSVCQQPSPSRAGAKHNPGVRCRRAPPPPPPSPPHRRVCVPAHPGRETHNPGVRSFVRRRRTGGHGPNCDCQERGVARVPAKCRRFLCRFFRHVRRGRRRRLGLVW